MPVNRLIVGINNGGAPLLSATYSTNRVGVVEVVFEVPATTPQGEVSFVVAVEVGGQLIFSNPSVLTVR